MCGKDVRGEAEGKEIREKKWLRGYCNSEGERGRGSTEDTGGQGVPKVMGSGYFQEVEWLGRQRVREGGPE